MKKQIAVIFGVALLASNGMHAAVDFQDVLKKANQALENIGDLIKKSPALASQIRAEVGDVRVMVTDAKTAAKNQDLTTMMLLLAQGLQKIAKGLQTGAGAFTDVTNAAVRPFSGSAAGAVINVIDSLQEVGDIVNSLAEVAESAANLSKTMQALAR